MTSRSRFVAQVMLVPQSGGGTIAQWLEWGTSLVVRNRNHFSKGLLAVVVRAAALAGCWGGTDMFQSALLSKDAEWFSRPGRLFIRNVSIETPPLTPDKAVAAEDLVSAEGNCPGMGPAGGDANALTDGAAGAPVPSRSGTVALGHTECDVVRGIGAPESVSLSNNARGDRLAVVNFFRGQRAGIYTFTAGRLSSIERGAEPVGQPKVAKPQTKKKKAATQ